MEIDIAEQICLAVDQIIAKRLEDINYDTTITGTIVDNTDAKTYKYTCSNGSSNFIAYSRDTTYKVGDSVQITIPNGDYDQQKIIIGKYVAEDNDTPYIYTQPLDTIINVSSNLINNKEVIYGSLLANEDSHTKDSSFDLEVHLWTDSFDVPQAGFNRLGLAGQFRTWISSLEPKAGDFGYRLEIFTENPEIVGTDRVSIKDWIDLYNRVLNKEKITDAEGLFDATPKEWYNNIIFMGEPLTEARFKSLFAEKDNRIELVRLMLYTNTQITILRLERRDMYGDPYNYQSYYQQEAVFDISAVDAIVGMSLFFYETSRSFYNKDDKLMEYRNQFGNFPPNLFTKDPYVCLGYDLSSFDKEQAILYTMDSKGFRFENEPETAENQELNRKTVRLRWLHKFENGDIKVVNDDTEVGEYEVRWYRYKLGNPSADEYSGVYWERVENSPNSIFEYSFIPHYKEVQEQVKAIILCNGEIIRSNILTFNNELEVPNGATAELLAGLSIWCEDNSYGNYFLYGQNNDILKPDDAKRIRTFQARFADRDLILSEADVDKTAVELTEGQKIIWEFPLNNSMIIVDGFNYNYKRDAEGYLEQAKKYLEENPDYAENFLDKSENLWYNVIVEQYNERLFKLDGYYNNGEKIRVENGLIKIIRIGEDNRVEAHQDYRIEKTYASPKINNTVKCSVDKNGYTYSGSKELSFGLMGTNGTDATLTIDFNNNVSALTADVAEAVKITARLYDNNHNEVDFNNESLNLECEWTWAYYHQFSNADEEKFLTDALNAQGKKAEDLSYAELNRIRSEAVLAKVGESGVLIKTNQNSGFENNPDNVCFLQHPANIPMNENGLFMILQAKVKGWGNYDLIAYKAIPVRATRNYRYVVGPTEVIYNSAGYIDYYKGPYELYYAESVTEYDTVPSGIDIVKKEIGWQIYDPYWNSDKENKYIGTITEANILQPATMYFNDVAPYGAICYDDKGKILWIQPLVIMKNLYPSATLNRWDGKAIKINETEGYILTPAIASGKKNSDNTFSGVMIGDWADKDAEIGGTAEEITKQTGIYGFEHGAMSYAFKEDGTAFIGKDGKGRIMFDGNYAQIYSATYHNNNYGMMIDLGGEDQIPYIDIKSGSSSIMLKAEPGGSSIKFKGDGQDEIISITSDPDSFPLEIGDKFWVEWNGNLHANDATLHNVTASGHMASKLGVIGGWYIDDQVLKGGTTTFYDDGTYYWDESTPKIYLDAPNAAICGGRLKPSLDGSRMEVWGSLEIRKEDGSTLTGVSGNYIGHVTSGLPDKNGNIIDAHGIGMSVEGAGTLKVTTANIGLQFNGSISGGFISISDQALTLMSQAAVIAMYGNNIVFDGTQLEIKGISADKQKGIYARFA